MFFGLSQYQAYFYLQEILTQSFPTQVGDKRFKTDILGP